MKSLSSPRHQRGVAALLVTTLLCFAMLLVVAYASRNIVVEVQASANQVRSAQAREAAEAGIEWALARLGDDGRVGPDCRPSGGAGALSSRQRWLRFVDDAGRIATATWSDAGTPTPLRAACVLTATGWTCSCPANGAPSLPAPIGNVDAPAFTVEFAATATPGIVGIVATSCVNGSGFCAAAADAPHEASMRVQASFALLPALRAAPAAALTVRGNVDAGTAALGVRNDDAASAALVIDAGGAIAASGLRVTVPPGSSQADSLVGNDASLASLDASAFFARFFGMSIDAWSSQPAVTKLACDGDCTSTLAAAVAAGHRLLFIDSDLSLAGPVVLGTVDDPVVIVVRGDLRLRGAVNVVGLVHASSLSWDDADAPDASLRGAAIVGGYGGNGAADIARDDAVLSHLKTRRGSFVRVNGSWKDF